MRMAVGLIGLLFVIGIIVLIMSKQLDRDKGTLAAGKQAEQQVRQVGGRSDDDTPATKSFTASAEMSGNKIDSLLITSVVPEGAMDKYYGLKKGDFVVEIGQAGSLTKVNDVANGDAELAKSSLVDAFRTQQSIVVVRSEERITLPLPPAQPTAGAQPGANPAPAPPVDSRSPLQRQLDSIQKVPTH